MNTPSPSFRQPLGARRFEIVRRLGVGGHGEVYLAAMTASGGLTTEVAVKVLPAGLDPEAEAVRRLKDEGRLLGILDHPAIPVVHDLVVLDGRAALVTEYVPGADLDVCLRSADPPPLRAVLEVVCRVAEALAAAHRAPGPDGAPLALVHRDVKPSNIRIGRHGDVKLLDFGIAKTDTFPRCATTGAHGVVGSLPYLAPERLVGGADTPAADVYALGCVLFEAVAGERLFATVSGEAQHLHAHDPERHDRHVAERLAAVEDGPPGIADLIRAMLAHAPAARPTADQLVARAEELAESSDGEDLKTWARRHPWRDDSAADGPLAGRVLSETTLVFTPPPRPASPGLERLLLPVVLGLLAWAAVNAIGTAPPQRADHRPTPDAAQIAAPGTVAPPPAGVAPPPAAVAPPPAGIAPSTAGVAPPPAATPPAATPPASVAPSRSAPPSTGPLPARVTFRGDAGRVVLVDETGARFEPRAVPPGRYQIEASFPGDGVHDAGELTLHPGERVELTCKRGFFLCVR